MLSGVCKSEVIPSRTALIPHVAARTLNQGLVHLMGSLEREKHRFLE